MKTKIACTLGPSLREVTDIEKAISLGCRIYRINFSHGNSALWRQLADNAREAAEKHGEEIVLIGDLRGPSIRVSGFEKSIILRVGERTKFSLDGPLSLPYPRFFQTVDIGDTLVFDDGRGMLKVVAKDETSIEAEAIRPATISPNKSIVIRGKEVQVSDYLETCREQLEDAADMRLDYVGLSFVTKAADVDAVKTFLLEKGVATGVIAKIETPSGVKNVDEISERSDAVLIARGDLGMHFHLEYVPRLQKTIIDAAYYACKPVIVATQLLGSMVNEPVPSRSEIVDVMTCVEDGVDVLMLTAETAVGHYPLESIQWLANIAETYEKGIEPRRTLSPDADVVDRFALAVVHLAESLAAKIAIFTMNGNMARRIARFKPVSGIIAATPNKDVVPRLMLLWGVTPLVLEAQSYAEGLELLEKKLEEEKLAEPGDTYVLTYGLVKEPVHIVKMKKFT
ncbi:MAG: pyruvate kinase [Candidatus Caldarchaeum sp.]